MADSTGLRINGEGECKVRRHGAGKRRTWRKVHWAFDADVKDALAIEVTTAQWTDGEVFAGLLNQIEGTIPQSMAMARTTRVGCTRRWRNGGLCSC